MTASMIGWLPHWSCWVPNTRNNGSIALVKGSHHWGVLDHYSDEITTSYKQWCITPEALREYITDESMIIPIEGDAGDVCFFDCRIVHGSNHNFSPAQRYSLIYAFAAIATCRTALRILVPIGWWRASSSRLPLSCRSWRRVHSRRAKRKIEWRNSGLTGWPSTGRCRSG